MTGRIVAAAARLGARLGIAARGLTLVGARVLRPDGTFGARLRVAGGRIAAVDGGPGRGDLVVDGRGALVVPGLVNAHDHLELNSFGRLKWRDRYDHVREWIADFQPAFATEPALRTNRPETLDDRLFAGMLKNLLGGATTVCHHNPLYPPLRNGAVVRVVRRFGWGHSLAVDGASLAASYRRTPARWPWIVHAAEGVDGTAAAELAALAALGCVRANTVLVHGVGLRPTDRRHALGAGCALVWCPSSNFFLFGTTAEVRPFSAAGRLAIGTDSRLSGEGDLLDELRVAAATRVLSPRDLIRAVTTDAAEILRLRHAGTLAVGAPADVVVFAPRAADPFESLVSARRTAIRLLLARGRPVIADVDLAHVFEALGVEPVGARLDGVPKLVAKPLAVRARRSAVPEPGFEVDP
jgi:hypothetical protein